MVRREHDTINADLKQEVKERRCPVEASERVVNILAKIGSKWTAQLRNSWGEIHIDSRYHEGEGLTHMADHELQLRVAVKYSTEHEADYMDGGLDMPAPGP